MALRSVLSRIAGRAITPELRTSAAAQASRSMATKASVNGIPVEVCMLPLISQITTSLLNRLAESGPDQAVF